MLPHPPSRQPKDKDQLAKLMALAARGSKHNGDAGITWLRGKENGESRSNIFSDYIPTTLNARLARLELFTLARTEKHTEAEGDDDVFPLELRKDQQGKLVVGEDGKESYRGGRIKYLLSYYRHNNLEGTKWDKLGVYWASSFHLWMSLLPERIRWFGEWLLDELDVFNFRAESAMLRTLKDLSSKVKFYVDPESGISMLFKELGVTFWTCFVNLEVLADYRRVTPENVDDVLSDAETWLGGGEKVFLAPNPITRIWDEDSFYERLGFGIRKMLYEAPNKSAVEDLSREEFASDASRTAGSGSTTIQSKMYFSVGDKVSRFVKSKATSAAQTSPDEKMAMLRGEVGMKQESQLIAKQERGKVRGVAMASYESFTRQKYFLNVIVSSLWGYKISPLWAGTRNNNEMWRTLVRNILSGFVAAPMDQSGFDHNITFRTLRVMFESLLWYADILPLPEHRKKELKEVIEMELRSITEEEHHISFDKTPYLNESEKSQKRSTRLRVYIVRILVLSGMLSGWAMTADADTLINVGYAYVALAVMKYYGVDTTWISLYAQGDDDAFSFASYLVAIMCYIAYELMGLEVNPYKGWISRSRDEFLRLVVLPYVLNSGGKPGTQGYLARAIGSIMIRNPISSGTGQPSDDFERVSFDRVGGVRSLVPQGLVRARELLDSWNKVLSRGGDPDVVFENAVLDISYANKIKPEDVINWMATPACFGGGGFRAGSPTLITGISERHTTNVAITPGEVKEKFKLESELPGYNGIAGALKTLGLDFESNVLDRLVAEQFDTGGRADTETVPGEIQYNVGLEHMNDCFVGDPADSRKVCGLFIDYTGPGKWSRVAKANKDLPQGLAQWGLEVAMSERRSGVKDAEGLRPTERWIEDVWLDPGMKQLSQILRHYRAPGKVWADWITGSGPWNAPMVQGWSGAVVSEHYKRMANQAWDMVVSKGGLGRKTVLSAAYAAEVATISCIREFEIYRLGE